MEVRYIFGGTSGYVLVSSWIKPGSKTLIYRCGIWGVQGEDTSSNFIGFGNPVDILQDMGIKEDLEGREIFIFADNTVYESIAAKGSSTSDFIYGLVVRVFKSEM